MQPPTGQPTTSLWDANGNLLSENAGGSITTYSWNGDDRLVGVAYPSGAPDTFAYSNDGLRQKKAASAGVVQFVWDGQNALLETDGSGVTQAHYTDFPGMWGGLSSQRRGAASSFYGFDPQANSRILLTILGAISDSYLYRAFGEELAVRGSTVNPVRFGGMVGYLRDLAVRLYVRARHYEPGLGRWISRDPAGPPGDGAGGYGYVVNAVPNAVDPSGLQGLSICPSASTEDCNEVRNRCSKGGGPKNPCRKCVCRQFSALLDDLDRYMTCLCGGRSSVSIRRCAITNHNLPWVDVGDPCWVAGACHSRHSIGIYRAAWSARSGHVERSVGLAPLSTVSGRGWHSDPAGGAGGPRRQSVAHRGA